MRTHFQISEVRIGCWNIHGIYHRIGGFQYNKLNSQYVRNIIEKRHIFCLMETHHIASQAADLHLDGFHNFSI